MLTIFNKKKVRSEEAFSLDGLREIISPDVNFCYIKRNIDEDIVLFARLLIEHKFKGIKEVVTKGNVKSVITEQLDNTQIHTSGKVLMAEDITRITTCFMEIINQEAVQLYLKVVDNDACTKFHTDRYDLRLLCTYIGKGTEWIEEPYVNRKMLMHGENHHIIRDFTQVQTMQPFEVGILKGEASKKNKNKGIVHRSPPIAHLSETRLLLRLDY